MNIDNLMLKPEWFPAFEKNYWDIFVPAHPSMIKERINPELVFYCLDEALKLSAEDFRKLDPNSIELYSREKHETDKKHKTSNVQVIYEWIKDKKRNVIKGENDIFIRNFPIPHGKLYISKIEINLGGSNNVFIKEGNALNEDVYLNLSKEILEEYGINSDRETSANWQPHNLDMLTNKIFFNRLALVYGNEIVKQKYKEKNGN